MINLCNPGQKSLGQFCYIRIFLSFFSSLLKLPASLLKISCSSPSPPPYTKLKLERKKNLDTCLQLCLWGEGRGWTCVNWKTPQKCHVHDCRLIFNFLHPLTLGDKGN